MNFLEDVYKFIECLSIVDIIFFIAILALLILLVTLVYFIKINNDVLDNDGLPPANNLRKKDVMQEGSILDKIEIKEENNIVEEYNDEEAELIDLEGLTKKLKEEDEERVNCTKYEKDQEEKAIISYDELVKKHNRFAINYEKEEVVDDLLIKKVNLNDLVNKEEEVELHSEVRVISYQKEEAFLKALKEFNELLN